MAIRVDTRSIVELRGSDLVGVKRAHFFAGIGGWELALRMAGWPEDREVWTGSCPCQPFSHAGKGLAEKDPRHLWPDFYRLISECRPATIFGEQVSSPSGKIWLSNLRADLEKIGYRVGAADLSAAGVGAPHIRQRFYWVADSNSSRSSTRFQSKEQLFVGPQYDRATVQFDWESQSHGISPFPLLANGVPAGVAGSKGFGNAIVPGLAAEFIAAYLEAENQ